MSRVSQEVLDKLHAFIDALPPEVQGKCALCNETLTHIVKTAEAQTGAGTATVARALADRINEDAAPGDVVSEDQLRGRVQRNESICTKRADKHTPCNELPPDDDEEIVWEEPTVPNGAVTVYRDDPIDDDDDEVSPAEHFVNLAIGQLEKITADHKEWNWHFERLVTWIMRRRKELQQ